MKKIPSKNGRGWTVFFNCDICGKEVLQGFSQYKKSKGAHYCSYACCSEGLKKQTDVTCSNCGCNFPIPKWRRNAATKFYCSRKCKYADTLPEVRLTCSRCQKLFTRTHAAYLKWKRTNKKQKCYCSKRCCTADWAGQNHAVTVSKNEKYLASLIRKAFPKLKCVRNTNKMLDGKLELDFFFPELSVAIEWNGPFHYRAVFGKQRLSEQRARDKRKRRLAKKKGIQLVEVKDAKGTENKLFVQTVFKQSIEPMLKNIVSSKLDS